MRVLFCLLVLAATLSAPALSAPTADSVDYQVSSGVRRTVLANGLVVLVKSEPHSKSVAIELLTRVGAAQEDDTTSGILELVGHMLEHRLNQSGLSLPRPDDPLDRTGTVAEVNVSLDYTELSLVTTPEHSAEILKRLTDAYSKRPFDTLEIDSERKKLVKNLEAGRGDFNGVYDLFLELFYRYHPYRQPLAGNLVAVRKLDAAHLNEFIARWYSPNRTILCVVGNVDSDLGKTVADSKLGALPAVKENSEIISWEPVSTEKEIQLTTDQRMAFLFLGYPAPSVQSNDYAAMKVLTSILGGGVSSRMWMDLREERGLAYELGSNYPTLEGPSHILSFVITTPRQVRAARKRLFFEIERIRTEDVPDWELEYGKWKTAGAALSALETPHDRATDLASKEAQGVGYEFTDQFIQAVWKVTPSDIRRVAIRYLDHYTLLVARPPGTEPLLPDHL